MKRSVSYKRRIEAGEIKPVFKVSICTGETVAGFKDLKTGRFEDVMLISGNNDIKAFCREFGIRDAASIEKIY